jgi:CHAD domain-containing protein
MASARDIPGINADATYAEAAASAVEVRAAEVFEFSARALDIDDIEGVHDMRVATRRLRAVMEIFAPCFPTKENGVLLKEVKLLADVLGERRDPDVMIDGLRGIADALTSYDHAGIAHLEETLAGDQTAANDRLAVLLERIERERLRERLIALAQEAREAQAERAA